MIYQLEIIGYNLESCRLAQEAGATRIELCSSAAEGGTTPSYGCISNARRLLHIPLFPMIRPRGGDFVYSADEFTAMAEDIMVCRRLGCDGVVLGLLQADGRIDKERTNRLVEMAYPMEVTFHRAFDRCINPLEALEDIIEAGCDRLLTSGQQATAEEGIDLISRLAKQAAGRIIIMPGSGVRNDNIQSLAETTGLTEFHSSALQSAPGEPPKLNVEQVRAMAGLLNLLSQQPSTDTLP